MQVTERYKQATESLDQTLPEISSGFEVQFKSHWIKTMVLRHLEFLNHLDTAVMIQEMRAVTHSSALAGFLYEGYAAQELAAGVSSDLVSMKPKDGTATFFIPKERHTIESPFNRPRERSYPSLSAGPLALKLNISPEKSLSDYFWIPMASNNPLFDAFVIEFKDSANAVVWVLQMTLSTTHGGSSDGYSIIRLIKKKVQEAMGNDAKQRKRNNVTVKYVLVNPDGGEWTLPEKNRRSCQGAVYYQRVNYRDEIHVHSHM